MKCNHLDENGRMALELVNNEMTCSMCRNVVVPFVELFKNLFCAQTGIDISDIEIVQSDNSLYSYKSSKYIEVYTNGEVIYRKFSTMLKDFSVAIIEDTKKKSFKIIIPRDYEKENVCSTLYDFLYIYNNLK